MSVEIQVDGINVQITAEPLTHEAFASFGDVVTNPRPNLHPTTYASQGGQLPYNGISANQGTAIQYRNVSRPQNLYAQAPSGDGQLIMSQFVCGTRQLAATSNPSQSEFTIGILERHPFTSQTFTPLASTASIYLVIVAPSLPSGLSDEGLLVPTGKGLPGRGLPDLRGLKAFVATSKQAVTYGAGTWHAPMVTLGEPQTSLDFLVIQFSSGIAVEDCQLAIFKSQGSEEPNIKVRVPALKERVRKL
ncbi:ureidoglycolate hydrolase [Dactylonectria estremocensis]|uniref:Ureidoglycolate hydrolase n=1 Tax=Dactylonectria estremocensis TaxID=1079267 RepID=A0A9P9F1H1_9HYPO|nr:ureidoglycolate hydrolase [Dactylonectria estremocensis]